MADQNRTSGASRAEYRRQVPHISQAPIDDVEPEYGTIDHYTTLEQQRNGRRHMGTATSDPEYLPQTEFQKRQAADPNARATPIRDATAPRRSGTVNYDRYLQTPKQRKSIFTSRQARQHQMHVRMLAALLVILIIALALVWFFVLK